MFCYYNFNEFKNDEKVKQGLKPSVCVFDQCKTDEELSAKIRKLHNLFISMESDTEKVLELFSKFIKDDELLEDWLSFIECMIMCAWLAVGNKPTTQQYLFVTLTPS